MPLRINDTKLKSATLIETIIALLILMISFSAGMVIYTRVITSGVSYEQLRADTELMFIMDSLIADGHFEPVRLARKNKVVEVVYTPDEEFTGILLMSAICTDEKGKVVVKRLKWVKKYEE